MPYENSYTVMGHLGQDVEVRYSQSGVATAQLSIATRRRKKVEGEWTNSTVWIRAVTFGKPAEWLAGATKGDLVYARGPLDLEEWTGNDGQQHKQFKLIATDACYKIGGEQQKKAKAPPVPAEDFEDDVPF